MNIKHYESLAVKKFGEGVRLEEKNWYLPTPHATVTLCYIWKGDSIVGMGANWEDLLK